MLLPYRALLAASCLLFALCPARAQEDKKLDARLRDLEKTIAAVRNLEFKEPVTCSLSCKLLISEAGFELGGGDNYVLRMIVPSEPTFVSVLDPDSVPAQKQYGLARRIPPGEVERFFIAVVSKKSARFRVRLKFFADKIDGA